MYPEKCCPDPTKLATEWLSLNDFFPNMLYIVKQSMDHVYHETKN